jgi:hypothetical protein
MLEWQRENLTIIIFLVNPFMSAIAQNMKVLMMFDTSLIRERRLSMKKVIILICIILCCITLVASCVHDTSINKPIIRSHDTSVPSIESAGKVPLVYTSVPPLLSTNVPSLISTVASPIKNTSVPSLISISVPPLISNVPPLIYTSVPPLISTNVLSTSKLPSKHISILSSPPPLIKSTNAKNISSIVYPSVNATTVNETYPVNKSSSSSSSQLSVIKDISHVQHVQCFLEENQPTGDKRVIKRKPVIVNKQLQTHQKPTTLTNSNDVILVKPIVKEDSLSSSSSSVDVTIKSVRRKMTQVS